MRRDFKIQQAITTKESRSVECYLTELSRISLIDANEEALLAQRSRKGDLAAKQHLVRSNLRFVISVAKQYQNMDVPLADLIAEGNPGLMEAADKFDETRGFKFISYAVWLIRQRMTDMISDHSRTIRLPQNQTDTYREVMKALALAEQRLERQPTTEELSELTGITKARIDNALYYNRKIIGLHHPVANDSEDCLLDHLSAGEPLPMEEDEPHSELYAHLSQLSVRERSVITLAFGLDGGLGMVPAEIAPILGLSAERVRQIKNKVISQLRSTLPIRY